MWNDKLRTSTRSSRASALTRKQPALSTSAESSRSRAVRRADADDCSEIWAGSESEPSDARVSLCRESVLLELPPPAAGEAAFLQGEIAQFRAEVRKLETALARARRDAQEKEEFVFFLQGKYRDQTPLEQLRSERLVELRERLTEQAQLMEEKDELILALVAEKGELERQHAVLQGRVEAEGQELRGQLLAQQTVNSAARREREQCHVQSQESRQETRSFQAALSAAEEELRALRSELRMRTEREQRLDGDCQQLRGLLTRCEQPQSPQLNDSLAEALEEENAELRRLLERERAESITQLEELREKVGKLQRSAPTITVEKAVQTGVALPSGQGRGCQVDTLTPQYKEILAESLDLQAFSDSLFRSRLDAPELLPTSSSLQLDPLLSSLRGICLALNSLARRRPASNVESSTSTDLAAAHYDTLSVQRSSLREQLRRKERASLKLYSDLREAKVDSTKLTLEREELKQKLKDSSRTPRTSFPREKSTAKGGSRFLFETLSPEETFSTFVALLQKLCGSENFVKRLRSSQEMKAMLQKVFVQRY